MTVRALLADVAAAREEDGVKLSHLLADAVVDELLSRLDGAVTACLDGMTVLDLSRAGQSPPDASPGD